jgi:hypothetical protein
LDAPRWIDTANILLKAYKANRTPENKANLDTAIAVLQAGADEARDIGAVVDMAVKIRSDSVSRRVQ